jgi:DNA-directed RNA polymerase specialized sigma24 family protein
MTAEPSADAVSDRRAWAFRCAFNVASSTFRRRSAERRALARLAPERAPTASTLTTVGYFSTSG